MGRSIIKKEDAKRIEELEYLKDNHLGLFLKTRQQAFDELSEKQTTFCCCGRLATGLHEYNCSKFNNKVDVYTINRLRHLLPNEAESK